MNDGSKVQRLMATEEDEAMSADAGFFESKLSSDQIGWLGRYPNIDHLIGRLTQSAIDAHMVSKGWTMVGSSEDATAYRRSTSDARGKGVNATTYETCTRPGRDGSGGGQVTTVSTLNGVERDRKESSISFDIVQKDIHDIVDKFVGCPDPSDSAEIASLYNAIACHLIAGPGGSLTPALGLIKTASEVLTGSTATRYKETFLWAIETLLDNFSALSMHIAYLMASQSGMWAGVRANTVGMLIKSRMKFKDVAEKGPAGYDYVGLIDVVDIALDVADIFTPKPVSKAIKLLKIASGEVPREAPDTIGDAGTYSQVLNKVLKAGLDSIAKQIEDLETRIKYNVGVSLDEISNPVAEIRSLWQLPSPESLDLSDEPDIATDLDSVSRIKDHMKSIVDTIEGYLQSGRDANRNMTSSVVRSASLGSDHFGPGPVMQELGDMFCDILTRLNSQIDLSADNLYGACMVLLSKNEEFAVQVAESAAGLEALDSPNGYADPWRYSKDPRPSPVDQALVVPDMWRMRESAPTSPILSAPPGAQHMDFQEVIPEFGGK